MSLPITSKQWWLLEMMYSVLVEGSSKNIVKILALQQLLLHFKQFFGLPTLLAAQLKENICFTIMTVGWQQMQYGGELYYSLCQCTWNWCVNENCWNLLSGYRTYMYLDSRFVLLLSIQTFILSIQKYA